MTLHPNTAQRLAYIRLLADRAIRESTGHPPYSYDALSRMHDAVESFLALAVQDRKKQIPKRDFMDFWSVLGDLEGGPLTHHARMRQLNEARVGLKHHGIAPVDVDHLVSAGLAFMEDECPRLFGIELAEVSMADYIAPQEARDAYDAAREHWTAGEHNLALGQLRACLHLMLRDFERREAGSRYDSMRAVQTRHRQSLRVSRRSQPQDRFLSSVSDDLRDFDRALDDVNRSLTTIDERLLLITLGIDPLAHRRFLRATPYVSFPLSGDYHIAVKAESEPPAIIVQTAHDFLITVATHLATIAPVEAEEDPPSDDPTP